MTGFLPNFLMKMIKDATVDRHRLLGMINTGGIFADRLLDAILSLPAISLSTSFLPSLEAEPGEFAIIRWIKA